MRDNELNEKEKEFIRRHPYAAAAIEHHRHRRLIWTGNAEVRSEKWKAANDFAKSVCQMPD